MNRNLAQLKLNVTPGKTMRVSVIEQGRSFLTARRRSQTVSAMSDSMWESLLLLSALPLRCADRKHSLRNIASDYLGGRMLPLRITGLLPRSSIESNLRNACVGSFLLRQSGI